MEVSPELVTCYVLSVVPVRVVGTRLATDSPGREPDADPPPAVREMMKSLRAERGTDR
jgi:hypothetical protein